MLRSTLFQLAPVPYPLLPTPYSSLSLSLYPFTTGSHMCVVPNWNYANQTHIQCEWPTDFTRAQKIQLNCRGVRTIRPYIYVVYIYDSISSIRLEKSLFSSWIIQRELGGERENVNWLWPAIICATLGRYVAQPWDDSNNLSRRSCLASPSQLNFSDSD